MASKRIEVGVRRVAGVAVRIDADARPQGRLERRQHPARGVHLAVGLHALHVDAALDGVAAGGRDRGLLQAEVGQRRATRDAQLRLDQVDAGHLFGDGVLDLQARVRLDEGEVALVPLIDQKLEGAQAQVVDGGGHAHGRGGDPIACRVAQPGTGRQLDDLLVAPLQAALALAQVRDAALPVADHLHLDVPRPRDQPLHEDGVVAEGGARLGLGAGVGLLDLVRVRHDAHPAPAAAGDRLDHHCAPVAEGVEEGARLVQADGVGAARQDRHVVADGQIARLRLVAEQLQRPDRGPHEGDPLLRAAARERRVLGQEAVARMHGVAIGRLGRFDDRLDVEVAARAGARQRPRLVRPANVQRRRVVGRVDRHRGNPQLARGAHDPDRDLAAVRDEQLLYGHHRSSCWVKTYPLRALHTRHALVQTPRAGHHGPLVRSQRREIQSTNRLRLQVLSAAAPGWRRCGRR